MRWTLNDPRVLSLDTIFDSDGEIEYSSDQGERFVIRRTGDRSARIDVSGDSLNLYKEPVLVAGCAILGVRAKQVGQPYPMVPGTPYWTSWDVADYDWDRLARPEVERRRRAQREEHVLHVTSSLSDDDLRLAIELRAERAKSG